MARRSLDLGHSPCRMVAVATWDCRPSGHEAVTQEVLARKIASLIGLPFVGKLENQSVWTGHYAVPRDTLAGDECADLTDAAQFFGGRVSSRLLATKAIFHPAATPHRPPEHPSRFAALARHLVLRGATAYTVAQAVAAGERLIAATGAARLKPVLQKGGNGQSVVRDVGQLQYKLAELADGGALVEPVVVEEDVADAFTWSVGTVAIGTISISYWGTQHMVRNRAGQPVYGGSTIVARRCALSDLARFASEEELPAIERVARLDRLAAQHISGLVASRRNYDVIEGRNAAGQPICGVLEQSWRAGGASGAELAALEVFAADPAALTVRASTVECYDEGAIPPADAAVYYRGPGDDSGPSLKYAIVDEIER